MACLARGWYSPCYLALAKNFKEVKNFFEKEKNTNPQKLGAFQHFINNISTENQPFCVFLILTFILLAK
jgi:hypothetical protein